MSKPIVLLWKATSANLATVASMQDLSVAGPMVLNSSVAAFPKGPYIYENVIRNISLTSPNDNSGVNFTITGIGIDSFASGVINEPITETISGPNGNSVFSTKLYQTIYSIVSDNPFSQVSVGFGDSGLTSPILMDYNRKAWYAACSAITFNQASATYNGYMSLEKIETPNPDGTLNRLLFPNYFFPISTSMTNATDSEIQQLNFPVSTVFFYVTNASALNIDEEIRFVVLQQGIN
jgi:hypothetical protein